MNPPDKVKLGFPFYVKFQINDSYGTFSEWKVYAGGIGEEHLLPAEDYAVGNEESSDKLYTAGITIKKKHDNIRIVPEVAEHPGIQFEHPSVETEAGAKKETGTITPRGSSKQIVGKAFEVSVKMNEDYAFYDWEIFQRSAGGNVTLTPAERTNEDGEKILEFSDSEGEVIFTAENLDEKKYLDEAACSMTIKKDLKDRKFIITAKTVERPKLKMCSPGNGASEINRAASIILNFTKPIKKESFTLNDITVKAENANNIPLDYVTAVYGFNEPFFSNNDATVRIPGKGDENHLLPQDGLIYVTLSGFISSVEDGKDIPLGKDYSFYFSTGKITDGDFDNSGFSAEFYQKVNSADFVIASSTSAQYETISKNRVTLKKNFSGMINISNAQRSDENESTMFKFKLSGGDKSGVSQIILRERYFITDGGTQLFSESGEWKNVPGYSQSDCEKEYAYVLTDLPTSFGTGNDTYGFDFTLGGKDDGVHQFSVICRDKYMNESTPQTVYVVKDTTPPKASDFKDFFELQNTENDNPNKTQYKTIGGKHYYRNINPMITLKLKEQMNDCGNELPQENLHLGSDDGNLKFKIGYSTSNTTAPTAESDVWNTLASNTTGTSQTVTLPKYDADVSGYRKFDLPYYIWLWVEDDFGNHDTALIDYSPMLDTTGPDVSDVKVYPLKTSGTNVWAKWSDKPKNGNMSEYDHTEIWYGGQKQNGTKEETDQQGWAKGVTQKSSENIEIRFYDKDGNYSKIVKQRPMTYHDGAYSLETECNLTTKTTITGKRQKDNVTDKVDRTVEIFGVEAGPMYFAWPDNDSNASHNKSASVTLGTFGTCTDDDLIEGTGNIAKMDGSWITIETKIEGGSYLTTTPSTEKTTGGVKNNSNPTVQIGDFYIQNYVMAKGFIQALI
ncbi:MAG: hypothetical protein HUK25_10495, partial [Treponema sp.]|nr:hypothetical protein [Treponema sp.]